MTDAVALLAVVEARRAVTPQPCAPSIATATAVADLIGMSGPGAANARAGTPTSPGTNTRPCRPRIGVRVDD